MFGLREICQRPFEPPPVLEHLYPICPRCGEHKRIAARRIRGNSVAKLRNRSSIGRPRSVISFNPLLQKINCGTVASTLPVSSFFVALQPLTNPKIFSLLPDVF